MSNKNLAILGVVAAVTVILAAILAGVSDGPRKGATGPTYLIQGLEPAKIGKITIGAGDDTVTLNRRGKGFVVADKEGYPADLKQVNELIQKCADIKITGAPQTTNPANHEDLEVTEDKGRSVVKFSTPDPNSELLTGLVVGKATEAGRGTYVRLLPTDSVYITLESPWLRDQATDYIDQDLISAEREDVNSVSVKVDKDQYTLKAGEGEAVSMENLPAGKKLKNTEARSVLTALTDLRFDDVTRSVGGLAFNDQYICRMDDSTVYTVSLAQKDGKTYAVCTAQFTGERPTKGKEMESEEELKEKEAKLLAYDNAVQFAARHKGWIYEIPDWKAKNLTKKLEDLLEDEQKPKDPNDLADPNAVKAQTPPRAPEPTKPVAPKAADAPKPVLTDETKAADPNAAARPPDPNAVKP